MNIVSDLIAAANKGDFKDDKPFKVSKSDNF